MSRIAAAMFDGVVGKRGSSHSVLERYTEATQQAICHARGECERRGDTAITVADLLGGLSVDEGTRAERIGHLKENAFYLRWLVGLPALPARDEIVIANSKIVYPCTAGSDDPGLDKLQLELDPEAKRAFAFALMEADRDREYWIDSDHLLRGLMRFPNRAHFAVLKTEINLNQVRIGSRRDREEFLPEDTPNLKVIQYLVRKYAALWLPPAVGLACYLYILFQGTGFRMPFIAR